jgi:hypothetical protein
MEKEFKEEKVLILNRVPPGDNWKFADGSQKDIYPSLTDALEAHYQNTGETKFYMDARKGTVEVVSTLEVEKPVKKFSLYGEDE